MLSEVSIDQTLFARTETVKPCPAIRNKKKEFDETHLVKNEVLLASHNLKLSPANTVKKNSLFEKNIKDNKTSFCYWFPELFGIEESSIPSSDEEEEFFSENDEKEKEEPTTEFTKPEIDLTNNITESLPKYGRRAKPKPILERENHIQFECSCEIDRSFSRHHVSRFGGGIKKEGEEFRTPHFIAYYEEFRGRDDTKEIKEWSKIIEEPKEEVKVDEGLFYRPIPKFPSSCRTEMKKYRQQLLSSFRPLECREIRRFRMPFCEALYLELQEDRYFESARFFKQLLIQEYAASNGLEEQSNLRENIGRMRYLTSFLKIAERLANKKEYHKEAIILLKSGKYFNDHNKQWWWIAEELYKKALQESKKSVIDGGKSEALSRYILGTFYIDCVYKVQLAQMHLSKSRELSLGKDWNAESILGIQQEPVFKECSNYLCQALVAASKELRKNGRPENALPLIHRSYKLCQEITTFKREIVMATYFELGMTYEALGMLDWARTAFKKFIEQAKLENYYRSVCDGYLELAITYRREGDLVRCHHNLINYLETAEANKDDNLTAFGSRYLGEYHLNNGNPKEAIEYLTKSFDLYHKQCKEVVDIPINQWKPEYYTLSHDLELTRTLLGIAEGERITKSVCQLILRAREPQNINETLKLISWKNNRMEAVEVRKINLNDISKNNEEIVPFTPLSPLVQAEIGISGSADEIYYRKVQFAAEKCPHIIL